MDEHDYRQSDSLVLRLTYPSCLFYFAAHCKDLETQVGTWEKESEQSEKDKIRWDKMVVYHSQEGKVGQIAIEP